VAENARSAVPELFESGEDYPEPLHFQRKRLAGWKLIAALAGGTVGVLVLSAGGVIALTLQDLQSSIVTVELPNARKPILPTIGEIKGGSTFSLWALTPELAREKVSSSLIQSSTT